MQKNKELELAWNFVEKTNRNIFLTGKAGTGKTTFLHKIKTESKKRLIVVAPTGVAAINAKGVTIHSFFQMPFGPILPDALLNPKSASYQQKFNRTKINIIKSLDLLIIDEISMVRADLLDGIDQVLRKYKNRFKPFGGVQLLMIGDLQQLAPIVRPNEWELLKNHYENMYFFNSNAYKLSNTIGVELKYIYRQDDEHFIKILNEIRNNNLSEESAEKLNKRYVPNFEIEKNSEYIILTTHNNKADKMNKTAYDKLKTKAVSYKADVHGKFSEYAYPLPENLTLRKDAQVMFIKNDSSVDKRYFNGKIGKIISLNDKEIVVKCKDEEIIVTAETWENINYKINNETNEIVSNVAGTYTQIPLKLAWAITIHKSQGLTFEKAIIDADCSFAHGQTYVALSRCKTLEGIVLKTKISSKSIISDNRVESYTREIENNLPDEKELNDSKKAYQLSLIDDIFNYRYFLYHPKRLIDIYYQNDTSIQGNILDKMLLVKEKLEEIITISSKFLRQINSLSVEINNLEQDKKIQERLQKAFNYFLKFTLEKIVKQINSMSFSTENKAVKKDIRTQLKYLKEKLNIKIYELKGLKNGFTVQGYLTLRANAVLLNENIKKESKEVYSDTTEHQILFQQLRKYRNDKAAEKNVEISQIFIQRSLYEMCNFLPSTIKQLKKIHGMGKVRISNYGEDILKIIVDFCIKNEIELTLDSVELDRPKKGSSQSVTLDMYKSGKTTEEIAETRELAKSTIEGHLAQFILTGDIKAIELMPEEKYNELKIIMQKTDYKGFGDLKSKIDNKFSYADLRIVAKGIEYEKSLFKE